MIREIYIWAKKHISKNGKRDIENYVINSKKSNLPIERDNLGEVADILIDVIGKYNFDGLREAAVHSADSDFFYEDGSKVESTEYPMTFLRFFYKPFYEETKVGDVELTSEFGLRFNRSLNPDERKELNELLEKKYRESTEKLRLGADLEKVKGKE